MTTLRDHVTSGINNGGHWLGGLSEIHVSDAPNITRIVAFTGDNSVSDGTVQTTYSGYTARIRDWVRISLAPFDVPREARAALISTRWEIRHVGDTDPGANTQAAAWLYCRVPGEAAGRTGAWPMDIVMASGSGFFVLVNQTALFSNGDGVRSAQQFVMPLVDRAFEASWGIRNGGSPNREDTTFRMDLFLMGWMK